MSSAQRSAPARHRGHVVDIASLAGKLTAPGLASYCASKHAVVGLTGALRSELAGTGVTVSAVLPEAVDTELASGLAPWLESLTKAQDLPTAGEG